MTNRQVVSRLRKEGHKVGVYVRKDGGIRITYIDGIKYSDRRNPKTGMPSGIQAARNMLFQEGKISNKEDAAYEAVLAQRREARLSVSTKAAAKPSLKGQSPEFQAKYKELQKKIRALNRRLRKEGRRVRKNISWQGLQQAAKKARISVEAQLRRATDYYEALFSDRAPRQMVEGLIYRLKMWSYYYPELNSLLDLIEANINFLDVNAFNKAAMWVYGYVQGVPQSETQDEIENLLLNTRHI